MIIAKTIINAIQQIPELEIIAKPLVSVFSFKSDVINIYQLGDVLDKKGWHLDRIQDPPALHMMVNPHHAEIVDSFITALRSAVKEVVENPEKATGGEAAIYGMVASMPDRGKVTDLVVNFLTF